MAYHKGSDLSNSNYKVFIKFLIKISRLEIKIYYKIYFPSLFGFITKIEVEKGKPKLF